ncbi:hypothetical protein Pmani_017426 [Petrolisthes manimaculis]|uniref:Uncharacterized protein n=1 Tax=Petrolisthes manimaculis TaxID=1843537 RepID=A0AAE1PQ52_9EUCA|nr:hypothetical protein Pmani_017426 [Petrolisthes manimaculis]
MMKQREPSMYKRLSSHITSIDFPDLPELLVPDAFRETASRVESALQHARSSYETHTRKDKPKDSEDRSDEKKEEEEGEVGEGNNSKDNENQS